LIKGNNDDRKENATQLHVIAISMSCNYSLLI